jgi:hypothetical protein
MKAICNRKQLLIRAYKGRGSVYLLIGESARTIEDCKKALSYYAKNTGANSSLKADIAIDFADAIL